MFADWVKIVIAAVAILSFPFVLLVAAKIVGYGWAAGQHKFDKRRRNDRGRET